MIATLTIRPFLTPCFATHPRAPTGGQLPFLFLTSLPRYFVTSLFFTSTHQELSCLNPFRNQSHLVPASPSPAHRSVNSPSPMAATVACCVSTTTRRFVSSTLAPSAKSSNPIVSAPSSPPLS